MVARRDGVAPAGKSISCNSWRHTEVGLGGHQALHSLPRSDIEEARVHLRALLGAINVVSDEREIRLVADLRTPTWRC